MKHLHDEVRIEAPVAHVWAFYCGTSQRQDWMPRVKSLEFSGPVDKVGTMYSATMRLLHEHSDSGPVDNSMRFEPDGEATRLVIDSDWELAGKLPGFIKDLVNKGWVERNTHQMVADFKALAEAKVPAHA